MGWTLLAALIGLMLSASSASAQEPQTEPERIVAAFMSALDNHDLDRAATFLAQDGQVIAPTSMVGRDSITQWLPMRFPPDSVIDVTTYAANGQRVSWMSRLTRGFGAYYPQSYYPQSQLTWDEAIVVNGYITMWTSRALTDTMTATPQFKRAKQLEPVPPVKAGEEQPAADSTPPFAQLLALGSGILVAGVSGVALRVWRRRSPQRRQRHNGRMLNELRDRLRPEGFTMPPRGGARGGARSAG